VPDSPSVEAICSACAAASHRNSRTEPSASVIAARPGSPPHCRSSTPGSWKEVTVSKLPWPLSATPAVFAK